MILTIKLVRKTLILNQIYETTQRRHVYRDCATHIYSHWYRFPFPRHIRDRRHVSGTRYVDLELGFQSRLVEARESTARIRWLELSRSDPSIMQNRDTFGKQPAEALI